MPCWREPAPAKVNLALDILRRRPDGYHDMYMVMQSVSLCDFVTVEEQSEGFALDTVGFAPPPGKTMEERAAQAFFAAIGEPMPGLRVALEKNIPAYAGLGGGSSDVAALLRILRKAYCPPMGAATLEKMGLSVGSDVPFCIRGGAALAEGRGEILTDLPPLSGAHIVLCKPPFGIPTPALFERFDRIGGARRPDVAGLADALRRPDFEGAAARMANVFEDVLPPEHAEVFAIKRRLSELGAAGAVMSGSGPTVCGLFRDARAAHKAADALRADYPETFCAAPLPANF
ncbi:MAG: 4-(cytidine 5'-diphospho)-2-C-methyl-D-erythritol kinase [Oscillibacter sp.]|nr:4-(cytidine 5'-diphospho)-2-C-methyl-D-erythritol kinase [Oscillibacter sp.]